MVTLHTIGILIGQPARMIMRSTVAPGTPGSSRRPRVGGQLHWLAGLPAKWCAHRSVC